MSDPFKYIEPDPAKIPIFEIIANEIALVYRSLDTMLVNSREKSLAITKLQEARMWANAAISFHEVNLGALEEK